MAIFFSALSVAFWLHVQKVLSKGRANQSDRSQSSFGI